MKHYMFNVTCPFYVQYTFTEDQVQRDAEVNVDEVEPTDEALLYLVEELTESLGQNCSVSSDVEVYADSNSLLGPSR